ncbi:inositol polyphosphate 1-phosphatase isoform X2 [Anabrus simplex]|uniref:inositol polyphosphate 1-phosphatase isoform X2 n=1 Tax=Anabrus simplex TaxID=316456 RepID=UPI0035A2C240
MSLLESLIQVSEKAANIARVCRQNEHLFKLLIQEKSEEEKNPRFVEDFKTLADVLIQETIKHDIGNKHEELREHIKGEESNVFKNTVGESVVVQVQEDEYSTASLLNTVLNGDTRAAELLAREVHRNVSVEDINLPSPFVPVDLELPLDDLGIWIDPIDSTAEYISGGQVPTTVRDIHASGLSCVTVLIGVYNRLTGEPVIGIVNQPFYSVHNARWCGRCVWGFSYNGVNHYSIPELPENPEVQKVIVLSSADSAVLKNHFTTAGYTLVEAAGAGYKCLCVALGSADAYLLSKGTTFRWDTCGPHALLLALGGGIVSYTQAQKGNVSIRMPWVHAVQIGTTTSMISRIFGDRQKNQSWSTQFCTKENKCS